MKHSSKIGMLFGLTSGVITTLGLLVGLNSVTGNRLAIIGGILTIAVADAFSDALGVHISEESENHHTTKEIWTSTIWTFMSKFVFALTFVVPFLFTPTISLSTAVLIDICWGISLLAASNIYLASGNGKGSMTKWHVVAEHLFIAVVVIVLSHLVGDLIHAVFA